MPYPTLPAEHGQGFAFISGLPRAPRARPLSALFAAAPVRGGVLTDRLTAGLLRVLGDSLIESVMTLLVPFLT